MSDAADYFPCRLELQRTIDRFADLRLAVVGDFFLDQYLIIDPARAERSVETGLTAHQVVDIRNSAGAAGTVCNNLAALDIGALFAVGVIGDDGRGIELRRDLEKQGVDTAGLLAAPDRRTPTYTKPMLMDPAGGGESELERLDIVNCQPTPVHWQDKIIAHLRQLLPNVDALIVLDQVQDPHYGVITPTVRAALAAIRTDSAQTLIFADSRSSIGEFRGVVIKANRDEALRAAALADETLPAQHASNAKSATFADGLARRAGQALFERTQRPVLITLGMHGILVTDASGQFTVPGCPVTGPVDITGAGDSATAGMVLAKCTGASWPQAAFIGNLVASVTVQQLGTTGTASRAQLLDRFDDLRS